MDDVAEIRLRLSPVDDKGNNISQLEHNIKASRASSLRDITKIGISTGGMRQQKLLKEQVDYASRGR